MENGIANVVGGSGWIDAASEPSPVGFNTTIFPDIANGAEVRFTRSAGDPAWAVKVVPASAVERMVAEARPPAGFTPDAEALVAAHAAHYLGDAPFAPTPAHAEQLFHHVGRRMARIRTALRRRDTAADPAAVETLLG